MEPENTSNNFQVVFQQTTPKTTIFAGEKSLKIQAPPSLIGKKGFHFISGIKGFPQTDYK